MSDAPNCGISFLIHGPSKAGKSWLGDTAPAPRLILDAEGGTRFLASKRIVWNPSGPPPEADGTWDTCITYIRDFSTLAHVYQWLASGKHSFKSVVLDSVSEAQQRCIDAVAGTEAMKIQDWGELLRKMSGLVRSYRDLLIHPTNPIQAVVLIAMTKEVNGKHTPYVQGQLATSLPYYIDVVGFLRSATDESGETSRFLLVQSHPNYDAGDRTGVFPAVLTNPNITEMVNAVCERG